MGVFHGAVDIIDTCNDVNEVYTDACLTGFGCIMGKDWIQGNFYPSDHDTIRLDFTQEHHCDVYVPVLKIGKIHILELYPCSVIFTYLPLTQKVKFSTLHMSR